MVNAPLPGQAREQTGDHGIEAVELAVGTSDRRLEWEGMDIIPFEGGKVKRKDVYSDSVAILRQVGLL